MPLPVPSVSANLFADRIAYPSIDGLTRPFYPADYAALCQVNGSVYPDAPLTPAEMRFSDEHRSMEETCLRRVFERGGEVVAYGELRKDSANSPFSLNLLVNPSFQRRGIGSALFDELQGGSPRPSLRCSVRDDQAPAIQFFERRGFSAASVRVESWLRVDESHDAAFGERERRLAGEGIKIRSFSELAIDPQRDRKLFDLFAAVVPGPFPLSYELFLERILANPRMPQEACFAAVYEAHYIGLSTVFLREANGDLWINMTGVRPEYRRKQIASVIKWRQIEYARQHGHAVIKTLNASENGAILGLNALLGYRPRYRWLLMNNLSK